MTAIYQFLLHCHSTFSAVAMYISSVAEMTRQSPALWVARYEMISVICDELIVGHSIKISIVILIMLVLRNQLCLDLLHYLRVDSHILVVVHVGVIVLHGFVLVAG